MLLFESAFEKDYESYERVYDTVTKSVKINKIPLVYEYFEESQYGNYSSLTSNKMFIQKQGSKKNSFNAAGVFSPIQRQIRDKYWSTNYNKTPTVMYLDIETRTGRAFKYHVKDEILKVQLSNCEYYLSAETIRYILNLIDNDFYSYVALDNDDKKKAISTYQEIDKVQFKKYIKDTYPSVFERIGGFPNPEEANEEISLFQVFDSSTETMTVLGLREWKGKDNYTFDYPVEYKYYKNEYELLCAFITLFQTMNPLIIYAWNGSGFDFPYIYNRLKKNNIPTNSLSCVREEVKLTSKPVGFKTVYHLNSPGHYFIDLIDVFKKYTYEPRTSYSLDNIAKDELKKSKVPHTEFEKFDDFYCGNYIHPTEPNEHQLNTRMYKLSSENKIQELREACHDEFVYYGCIDTYLIYEIDKKKNFTPLIIMMAEKYGVLHSEVLGTVKPWSSYLANAAYTEKKIIEVPPKVEEEPTIKGGRVMAPTPGRYSWLCSVDVNSMYPLLAMVGFNMSPETFVPLQKAPSDLREYILRYFNDEDEDRVLTLDDKIWNNVSELLQKYNLSLSINGGLYKRDEQGLIPRMVQEIYSSRKKAKSVQFSFEKLKLQCTQLIKTEAFGNKHVSFENYEHSQLTSLSDDFIHTLDKQSLLNLQKIASNLEDLYMTKQLAEKISINSLYGAIGNKYFPLFNLTTARAITGNGRYFIALLAEQLDKELKRIYEEKFNKQLSDTSFVKYSDTDSCYFVLSQFTDELVKEQFDINTKEGCKKLHNITDTIHAFIEKHVDGEIVPKTVEIFSKRLNAYNTKVIKAEREIIADKAVLVAKKKYFARVIDSEGTRYTPYKMKIMGLEIVKSSTPSFVREVLKKDALSLLLDKSEKELIDWKNAKKVQFFNEDLDKISKVTSVSNLNYELGGLSVPMQSRASLIYNKYIKEHNLEETYNLIEPEDKVKLLYLLEPNPFNSNIIAFKDGSFFEQFREYVDFDMNFQKNFESALQIMANPLNFDIYRQCDALDEW